MHAAEPRDPDCPSTVPKRTCTHARMAKMSEDPRRAGDKELWFGQLRLLFALTRGGHTFNTAFIRCYEAVPVATRRQARRIRQGLWLPAMPRGCSVSSGPKSGWAARAAPGTAASLSHPSGGRPSPSLIPPVRSATFTTTSCADAPVSSLTSGPAVGADLAAQRNDQLLLSSMGAADARAEGGEELPRQHHCICGPA